MTDAMGALLAPRGVAVVGASPREDSLGLRVIRNLQSLGFAGPIAPVNSRHDAIAGLPCYASVAAAAGVCDAAVLAVPAAIAVDLVSEAAKAGVRALVVPAGGFDDAGTDEGRALDARLKAAAAAHGLAVCGPNNLGVISVHRRAALWTARQLPAIEPGRLAIVSQSGSVAIALSQDERRLGLAYVISSGNEAVLTAADYLAALAADDRVGVIALFLEAIRDPRLFARAAAAAFANGKRVVALKVGRTEVGRATVAAHTGALAGDQALYDAFFRTCGVLPASDFEELIELSALCLAYPAPPPRAAAAVLTLSGGEAALAADLGADVGLALPAPAPATVERLRPVLPPLAKPRNPLDAWGAGWNAERFADMLAAVAADDGIGAVAIAVDAPASGGGDAPLALEMAAIAGRMAASSRIVFINNIAGTPNVSLARALAAHGIPCLAGLRPSISALAKWATATPPAGAEPAPRRATAGGNLLASRNEAQRFAILRAAGIPMAPCLAVPSAAAAVAAAEEVGYPVVLKGTAPSLPHRSELGLVRLDVRTPDEVRAHHADLTAALARHAAGDADRAVVLQPMVRPGLELIIGIRNEPGFGTLVLAGLGGVYTEILRDTAVTLAPISVSAGEAMLRGTRAGALLAGARGHAPYDLRAVAEALAALAELGRANEESVAAIEVNPLIVLEGGRGAVGVDVVIEARAGAR